MQSCWISTSSFVRSYYEIYARADNKKPKRTYNPPKSTTIHDQMLIYLTRRNILVISLYIQFLSILLVTLKISSPSSMPPKPKLNVQNFPRPSLLEKTPRHLQIKWHEKTIADTKDAFWVLETYHSPSKPSLTSSILIHRNLPDSQLPQLIITAYYLPKSSITIPLVPLRNRLSANGRVGRPTTPSH